MKTVKKLLCLTLAALLCTAAFLAFSACNDKVEKDEQGLEYQLIMSGYVSQTGGYMAYRVSGTSKTKGTITIPAQFKGLPVTTIADSAFKNAAGLNVANFASDSLLLSIGSNAFAGCTSLNNITIPSSVFRIYDNAFVNSGIWNNTPDNSIVYADKWAVGYKGIIEDVSFAQDTVGVSINAFNYCTTLTSLNFPASMAVVGRTFSTSFEPTESALVPAAASNNAHANNGVLVAYAMPEPLYSAFFGCTNLKSVIFEQGESSLSIGVKAFAGCTSLESMLLPDNLKYICPEAFSYCTNIIDIEIPENIVAIGACAFYDWTLDQTIYINGFSNNDDADAAFVATQMGEYYPSLSAWRNNCEANIIYQG